MKLDSTVCINSFFFSFEWNWVRNWPRIPQACWSTRASTDVSFHSDSIPIPYSSGRGRIFLLCLHQQACPSMSFRNNFINYISVYSIFNTNIKYIWKQTSCITQLLSYITRYSQVQGHSITVSCPTGGKKACWWNIELGGWTINTNVISLAFEGWYSPWHWCFLMWKMGPSSDLDWRCHEAKTELELWNDIPVWHRGKLSLILYYPLSASSPPQGDSVQKCGQGSATIAIILENTSKYLCLLEHCSVTHSSFQPFIQ